MNGSTAKQKLYQMLQTGRPEGRLDIPLDSPLPRYAGFSMLAAAAALLLTTIITYCRLDGFVGIFKAIFNFQTFLNLLLAYAPFVIIALLKNHNFTLFLIPVILLNLNNLRTVPIIFQLADHGSPLYALLNFIVFLCPIYLLVMVILIITEKLTDKKQIVYLLAIPVAVIAAICVIQLLISLGSNLTYVIQSGIRNGAASALARLFSNVLVNLISGLIGLAGNICLYAAYPLLALSLDNDPAKEYFVTGTTVDENGELVTDQLQIEKNVGLCIVFSIITCGIYSLYWLYTMVKKIRLLNHDRSSFIGEYLCLILVPFYVIYWFYTAVPRLYRGAAGKNIYLSDNRTLYLILSIFVPIAAYAILQADLNTVAKQLRGEIQTQPLQPAPSAAPVQNVSAADELAKFKKLLDDGVITQEEFDAKKKQLLGL